MTVRYWCGIEPTSKPSEGPLLVIPKGYPQSGLSPTLNGVAIEAPIRSLSLERFTSSGRWVKLHLELLCNLQPWRSSEELPELTLPLLTLTEGRNVRMPTLNGQPIAVMMHSYKIEAHAAQPDVLKLVIFVRMDQEIREDLEFQMIPC